MKIYKIVYDCHGFVKKTKIKARFKFMAIKAFRKKFPPYIVIMSVERCNYGKD